MKNKPKNIPNPYKFAGTKIFRDTTALPFVDGGPLHDRDINGKLLQSTYASPLGNMFREGGPFGENKGTFDYATSIYASQPGNYYANGGELGEDPIYSYSGRKDSKYKKDTKGNWLISNKSTGNKFIAIKDPTGSRSQELNKHAKLISTEDSNIQQLFDFGKKSLPQQKIVNKPIENKPFYGDISNAAQPDSFIENITEFADPTGYFSWDDAYRAKQSWDKSGSEYPTINEGLDMFGAVPGLGKLGKLKYLKNADAIKNSMKYVEPAFRIIPWQTILNGVDTGQDVNQDNITFKNGGMIKRADGSYSQRGLWDNIRANAGSGKKPTAAMLAQEKKINREYRTGGQFPTPYSLPEDSFKQGGKNLHNSIYASSPAQYPAVYAVGGKINVVAGGEKHRVYVKESPTGVGKGIEGHIMVNHPTMDKGQWDTIDLTIKTGAKTVAEGIAATKKWHKENPNVYRNGGMTSHFYASNVPDNNISNKDLTYPENSYVYALGGNLNNFAMNKYPDVTNVLKSGSGIHINPANKGKFTASAKAAGMGVQEFAHHVLANKDNYSATQVKRANFARNAAGWQHAMGGGLHSFAPAVPPLTGNIGPMGETMATTNLGTMSYKNGGHILAAGGWPPGLKLRNPTLSAMPYYTNATTGILAPSAELGLEAQLGKEKGSMGWSINPHIGAAYNTEPGQFPLSGGLDATYKGLRSPNEKGFAIGTIGAGYNPAQGFGTGVDTGYKYRVLGQSNKRLGELKAGKAALDITPYAGFQVGQSSDYQSGSDTGFGGSDTSASLIYGAKAEAQWRPKLFKHSGITNAPITFFGKGNFNVNPVKGKTQEQPTAENAAEDWVGGNTNVGGTQGAQVVQGDTGYSSALKGKPQYSFTVGARMPLSRIKEYMPERKGIPATGGEMYQEPEPDFRRDWTFASSEPNVDAKGKPIPGDYNESLQDYSNRINSWGDTGKITPRFNADADTRLQNAELPFQQIDYTQPLFNDEDYKYGGTMKFKYGGFNNPGFNALPKNVQAKIKARTFGDGGTMPQLTEFNEGGRHEENPLGGVPQGAAGDGRLNLVEEGETKLNAANYIFSDTLKVDKEIAEAFNLAKSDIGKTFADVSKKMNKPNSRRDNDTIEQNAKQRDLENLMLAQEGYKQLDLQKDMEMMERKHPEIMQAMQAAMQQQTAPQGPSLEEMHQGQPQMSPEEEQMMMQQQMAQQQGMMPEQQMGQIPMSYGGSMYMCGGKMYMDGGRMMRGGGEQVLRSIGAGAYGAGEGLLDTLTFGLTDSITDKGYEALANMGDRDEEDLERDRMIRGFGTTAGAITGGILSGGAATGTAISQGSKGLGEGLTNIKGTNESFDKTVNSLAKAGSMIGGLVGGGNPAAGLGGASAGMGALGGAGGAAAGAAGAAGGASQIPQFAQTMMKAGQNPFLQQVTGMAGSMMQRNGGHMYPTFYPTYKNNAGPMGQDLTNLYEYGGSFEMPRQQMYMPLDNVERMGGHLYAEGGDMNYPEPEDIPLYGDVPKININGKLYTKDEAIQAANFGEIKTDPEELETYFSEIETNNAKGNPEVITEEETSNEITYPGASNKNIITGGKGDYKDQDLTDEILVAEQMVKNAKNPKDKKEAEAYLSELKRADMALKDRNVNLGMKQTPLQALGLAAPVAYNIGMGLFGKPMKFKEEDFMNKSKVSPYKVNVYPQLNEANLAYNSAERALKDMSPSAGAYLTNRSNLANNRAKAISSILANKENVDAQLQMQADLQNAQLNAQNKGNLLAVQQLNAQSKAAKQKMLGEGLSQLGQMTQNLGTMDAQEKYMQLISPQYGKTFEYKTIFDQATDVLKNYRKNKSSNSEQNS